MTQPVTLDPTQQAAIDAMNLANDRAMLAQTLIETSMTKTNVVLAALNAADSASSKVQG